ncbi:MAG: histidine phosphatase family protein [Planctomycetaceae bacterium]|nr:histidine phosphatase family protein [Planctomycetaceae bacterium]
MRIGLLRHFPVEQAFPRGWLTSGDLLDWRDRYDLAATTAGPFDLGGIDWPMCLSSDSPRARITASTVFPGAFEHTPLLREPQFARFGQGKVRMPAWAWWWALRLAWLTGHSSQRACRDEFLGRVTAVADRLCQSDGDILVVSHAVMMGWLSRELRRRGFVGPKLRIAEHAKVYVYERSPSAG